MNSELSFHCNLVLVMRDEKFFTIRDRETKADESGAQRVLCQMVTRQFGKIAGLGKADVDCGGRIAPNSFCVRLAYGGLFVRPFVFQRIINGGRRRATHHP